MLDDIVGLVAEAVVRLVGLERCGIAIARQYHGETGVFMVYNSARVEEGEGPEEEEVEDAIGYTHD